MTVSSELLLHAYRSGVFPMSEHKDDPEIFWVDPRKRGVLPLDGFHISRSLSKALKRSDYSVSLNRDFGGVIDGCADRNVTWINDEIRDAYENLHNLGHAHSLEVWSDTALIGGVYGVTVGRAFCGESMFSRRTNASKIALAWLVTYLRSTGYVLFDTQFLTTHLSSLGGLEISRTEYRKRLADALIRDVDFLSGTLPLNGHDVVHRNTQTS